MAIRKVVWEKNAEKDYEEIIDYLKDNWGEASAKNFVNQVKKHILLISQQPKIFPIVFLKNKIRKSVIVKQISLYYIEFEIENKVVVIRLLDNRQDPNKIQCIMDLIDS